MTDKGTLSLSLSLLLSLCQLQKQKWLRYILRSIQSFLSILWYIFKHWRIKNALGVWQVQIVKKNLIIIETLSFFHSCLNPLCLFVWLVSGVFRPTGEFSLFGDITIADERLQILTYVRPLIVIEQRGFFNVPRLMDKGQPFKWSSPRTRNTYTCCRAVSSGAVTTCFNDLGLFRSLACRANAPAFSHCGGLNTNMINYVLHLTTYT